MAVRPPSTAAPHRVVSLPGPRSGPRPLGQRLRGRRAHPQGRAGVRGQSPAPGPGTRRNTGQCREKRSEALIRGAQLAACPVGGNGPRSQGFVSPRPVLPAGPCRRLCARHKVSTPETPRAGPPEAARGPARGCAATPRSSLRRSLSLVRAGRAVAVLRVALVVEAARAPDRPGATRMVVAEREQAGTGPCHRPGLEESIGQPVGQRPCCLCVAAEETRRVEHVKVRSVQHSPTGSASPPGCARTGRQSPG